MIERDIRLTANAMIKQFDEDAAVISATRADSPREQGDQEGYAVWKRYCELSRNRGMRRVFARIGCRTVSKCGFLPIES
jgi:hypothetical protein